MAFQSQGQREKNHSFGVVGLEGATELAAETGRRQP
jgi:hypothetical protein